MQKLFFGGLKRFCENRFYRYRFCRSCEDGIFFLKRLVWGDGKNVLRNGRRRRAWRARRRKRRKCRFLSSSCKERRRVEKDMATALFRTLKASRLIDYMSTFCTVASVTGRTFNNHLLASPHLARL